MIQRMKNRFVCTVPEDYDLHTATDLRFLLKQGKYSYEYTPDVISATQFVVTAPKDDMMTMAVGPVQLQFAFTDAGGNYVPSKVVSIQCERYLGVDGYGN